MTHRFDLLGPLPAERSTVVLEASAGTGKTFTLAGLVTRYLADGAATVDQLLLITFGRVASQELRERVRTQIGDAAAVLEGRREPANELESHLLATGDAPSRCALLRDALADFDAATIVTIHQFCAMVLKSLGVAGDTASSATLVESLTDLVTEIVDDHYLAHFGSDENPPPLTRKDAIDLATQVVEDPAAQLRPAHPDPESEAGVRLAFAQAVLDELAHRKRRLGILGYNDLLTRLAEALQHSDSDAADRMRRRWQIVMVDEFQDTDPVQWQVIDRAFTGHSTLVLIGDPKQAIYGFRGGDIYTYLAAVRAAGDQRTLPTNYRSDKAVVDSLQTVLGGAQLGHPEITVPPIEAHRSGHRLTGAPHNAPFRLRVVKRPTLGRQGLDSLLIGPLREHIPADLAADIGALLNSGARYDSRPVRAGDVAVLVEQHQDAALCRDALTKLGIPVVYTGDTDVFASRAAEDWLCLLEAFDQPGRTGLARAAACTMFFGETAESLARGGDKLTDRVTQTLREWTDHARLRGVAAVLEAAQLAGMGRRVLSRRGGERHMTDLAHIGQLLQETAHADRLGLPALRDWLRRQREDRTGATERNRRLDSDAGAVQIMTVFAAKGLQFPIVYLPFMFRRYIGDKGNLLYHEAGADGAEVRCLHIGGGRSAEVIELHRREEALDHIRITYVALTRAQSQVVAWWAPAGDEINGGLSRLLRGRAPGEAEVPDRCTPRISDDDAWAVFTGWQDRGGPVVEESVVGPPTPAVPREAPGELAVRHFHRHIDTGWRRTSYSALIRVADEAAAGTHSEPEAHTRDDESEEVTVTAAAPVTGAELRSPMADLPGGKTFGSLVHAVLETADPFAADLAAELTEQVRAHEPWWPIGVDAEVLAAALVPMHDTPLGPLAVGLTLRQIGVPDRLRELDFEIPLAGGDVPGAASQARVADVGALLREHLAPEDPFGVYADRLLSDALGGQSLRGYLSGSLDVVLRLPDQRYLVVDYKTNQLGETAADYSFPRMAEAMLHSDYPLQALLYTAVLHRFLRWRQPGYDPARHLGGVLYLFVRGMCGPDTPILGGHPAGVFSWRPPVELVVALSDLLHQGVAR
ncbi:RecBCD enzyme subunit RecB [Mycolicibacter terrae]|uniref:RecBCD enzyme subunit RecB n=1 Tax=Mycolicibacter terrae TaxID=1788 RepID=A0AAD1I5H3_9MYCO|nr:exodeoxyribonuclease V subunit beta [Mycolicibacter terrae]ORW96091.1 exodeoxyribonuclease V subunit beta [Mycolicibacter terrae]BBX24001.1 RecBCD enzyme subunit RecB [Mycolicibacter terrae]SNV57406.1 exodeoxyribonuclease V subunit beta [Mycolicibacter terrae]